MPRKLPPHVRVKNAKGKTYYYFDTGARNEAGRSVLKRLPSIGTAEFGPALVAAQNARERRGTVHSVMTITGLIELFQKSPEFRGLAASSQDNYRLYLGQIARKIGEAPAGELEARDVLLIRDGMADRPGAANQWIAALGALYKWGRRRQHVKNEPTKDIERFPKTAHAEWPVWLVEEALADPVVRLPVALLYFTAQRIGDVCAMRWSDIRDGAIRLVQQKTGKALDIPIHEELASILEASPRTGLTIMANSAKPMKLQTLRAHLKAWAAERNVNIVPHGLRRNAINALLECGCSVAETAAISGQTLQMVEHYAKGRNQKKLANAAILRWNKNGVGKPKVKTS